MGYQLAYDIDQQAARWVFFTYHPVLYYGLTNHPVLYYGLANHPVLCDGRVKVEDMLNQCRLGNESELCQINFLIQQLENVSIYRKVKKINCYIED